MLPGTNQRAERLLISSVSMTLRCKHPPARSTLVSPCEPWRAFVEGGVVSLRGRSQLPGVYLPSARLWTRSDSATGVSDEAAAGGSRQTAGCMPYWEDCATARSAPQAPEASPPDHSGCTPLGKSRRAQGSGRICACLRAGQSTKEHNRDVNTKNVLRGIKFKDPKLYLFTQC